MTHLSTMLFFLTIFVLTKISKYFNQYYRRHLVKSFTHPSPNHNHRLAKNLSKTNLKFFCAFPYIAWRLRFCKGKVFSLFLASAGDFNHARPYPSPVWLYKPNLKQASKSSSTPPPPNFNHY